MAANGFLTTTTTTALVAAQLATAWGRWRQRSVQQPSATPPAAAVSGDAQRSADEEAQYELVAMGLAAALSDEQLHQLFTASSSEEEMLTLLLPLQDKFVEDAQQFHFSLVVVAKLLAQFLENECVLSGALASSSSSSVPAAQWDRIVNELLLPLLRHQRYVRVHAVALSMLKQIVGVSGAAMAEKLASQVHSILVDDPLASSVRSPSTEQHVSELAGVVEEQAVSFGSLCGVLQLLLGGGELSYSSSTDIIAAQTKHICTHAIAHFDKSPLFLRAVAIQLVPALLRIAPAMAQELTTISVDAWRVVKHDRSKSIANLMYLLCLVLPSDPELMRESGLQEIVAFSLANVDPLLRKQGMYLLNIAFTHYALQAEGATTTSTAKSKNASARALETWQRFITASEVIQMHQQQHLLEQVWPQVTFLIESSLVVLREDDGNQSSTGANAEPVDVSSWPVKFSFDWIQSLLIRVFCHENPIVRRMFMSTFMETCLNQWRVMEEQIQKHQSQGKSTVASIDANSSFACSASFRSFVFEHLLRAFNDPQMYKSSTKEAFQKVISEFLSRYLVFQLKWGKKTSNAMASLPSGGLMKSFVEAVHEAIFGRGTTGHSPEALLSMLEVFCNTGLQTAVQEPAVAKEDLLDEDAIERLRMIMEFRVMRSFPQSIRVKITRSLVNALTGGFTDISTHSLYSLASILLVLPLNNVIGVDGSTFRAIHQWLRPHQPKEQDAKIVGIFMASMEAALAHYLSKAQENDHTNSAKVLGTAHLSRLLLFTADATEIAADGDLNSPVAVALQTPLAQLVNTRLPDDNVDSLKLLHLVGKFEEEVDQVVRLTSQKSIRAHLVFSFKPRNFYGAAGGVERSSSSVFSYRSLFEIGMHASKRWIQSRLTKDAEGGNETSQEQFENALDEASEKEDKVDLLAATALVVAQMAIYKMEQDGDLRAMDELNVICESLKSVISPEMSARVNASEQTLAIRYLSIVSSRSKALDSLQALQGHITLPLLLSARLNASMDSGSKHYARCNIQYFVSKWTLMHNVLLASSYVPTELLHRVFTACLDALPAVGADPLVLYEMVQVLSLALAQLASTFVNLEDRDERLDNLYHLVWGEYSECKAKPDILTRAVVYCLFQPAFLLSPELSSGKNATMKRWFDRFMRFGQVHRPNVIFHLTCRLNQVWRAMPHAALWFVDEIVALLLYKEPVIDEKEQLTSSGSDDNTIGGAPPGTSGLLAKNKFVRLVILSLLDEMSVDTAVKDSNEQQLLQQLIVRLLELNLTEEWKKQHMLNSDGFGKKIRCWQALCVLSKHVSANMVDTVNDLVWRAFVFPHLPAMRYYMEIFAMRLLLRFPNVTIRKYMVPLMENYNLMPQVGASLLLVAGYAVYNRLDAQLASDHELCTLLVESMLPWLNSSHGHTRILVQFMLAIVLPRYLHQHEHHHQQQNNAKNPKNLQFLRQTASFLSQNKECKRMHRRQLNQMTKFRPEFECSLLGVLSSAAVNEFLELFPSDDVLLFSAQFKDAMNELHAQFQRENFVEDTPGRAAAVAASISAATASQPAMTSLNVQRKIDTSAILLDESVLPVAMQERGEIVDVNVRNRRRQPVILCASLVDKTPNLAGLARTCEIFNAQKLIVPNLRVCEDETFSVISVTASKWMPIEQVRPDQGELVRALQRWKSEGYTIVALEQTSSSVCLSSFQFPEKIVIVLGKEKEGVPVDVLQMVDVCVEIPQFGLIRSLNVHVSGAILLWEYTQQQMLKQ